MSNPAVIKLQQARINGTKIWIDDNYGESVHIHIDDMRIDLTVKEFEKLSYDLCDAVNEIIQVPGFDMHKIDPVFFQVSLWEVLLDLEKVTYDKVRLSELVCTNGNHVFYLPDSYEVKALRCETTKNEDGRKSHHIGQTDTIRLNEICLSIKDNGYPYNDQLIILKGNDNSSLFVLFVWRSGD